jgi:site-specific DNA-cytosine methylase
VLHGLDLFSGIGGLSLALQPWVRTIAYCEIDEHCRAVIRNHSRRGALDTAPIFGDVRELCAEHLTEPVDIVFGGFPCQDISLAGRRAGLDGERSGLYREVVRLVGELRPTFVFLENVAAIRAHAWRVIQDLAGLGFDCRWTALSAAEVGAPHRRDRWWLLAAHPERIKLWLESGRGSGANGTEALFAPPPPPQRLAPDDDDDEGELQQSGALGTQRGRASDSIVTAWRDRADEGVSLLVHGLPVRMVDQRLTGNAVVPAQAREAFRRLLTCST